MPLEPGAQLGPYEVLAPLGAGGMGEVYRAKDKRLDRTVALKVLPQHLAADPDLRQRFEREARAVSSLNHPHICALFDVGRQDGTDFLVMEYLEGETLADRLSRGPLPTEQVLRYGIEIADALDKAHRQDIVHRDLKPGNVMLTKAGTKLLDFGLAKLHGAKTAPTASMFSALATSARPLTEHGTVLGTFQYMAPEQLEAKEADARTDVFALGSLLYEMATGKKAFNGKSQASLIAAILSAEPPPLASVQPMAPPALERLVKVCLAKDPDDRLQTAHDVMQELKWIVEAGSAAGVPAPVAARRKSRERLAWILAGVLPLVASAATLFLASRWKPATALRSTRFVVPAPGRAASLQYANLSPDGSMLAFLATVDGKSSVWLRALDSLEARPLPGTEGAADLMWSGDSRFLAFWVTREVKKIAVAGGPPLPLFSMTSLSFGEWNRDGILLFTNETDGAIYKASSSGGAATAVTTVEKGASEIHAYPSFLPDGRHFLFLARRTPLETSAITLGSLDSPRTRSLLLAESQALYAPSGHLLFLRSQTLMAQPFDARSFEVHGEAFPLVDGVMHYPPDGWGEFSVARDGTLAFRRAESTLRQLTWLDREGHSQGTIGEPGSYYNPALTLDDSRLAVGRQDSGPSGGQIWLFDLARGSKARFTLEAGAYGSPTWARDGQHVYFASNPESDRWEIRRKPWDSAGGEEVVLEGKSVFRVQDISPDGRFLAYQTVGQDTGQDLMLLPLQGEKTPADLVRTPRAEYQAQFSPDGRWLAYGASEGGKFEVYVQPYPDTGARWQISASGRQPRWRSDGKELFYLAQDGKLMAVDIEATARGLTVGPPRALFPTLVNAVELTRNSYVVARGGQRFLFVNPVQESGPAPVTIVLNWAAEHQKEP